MKPSAMGYLLFKCMSFVGLTEAGLGLSGSSKGGEVPVTRVLGLQEGCPHTKKRLALDICRGSLVPEGCLPPSWLDSGLLLFFGFVYCIWPLDPGIFDFCSPCSNSQLLRVLHSTGPRPDLVPPGPHPAARLME